MTTEMIERIEQTVHRSAVMINNIPCNKEHLGLPHRSKMLYNGMLIDVRELLIREFFHDEG